MKATRQLLPRRPPNVLAGFVAATLISALCASALAHESRTEWLLSGQVSIGQYDLRIYSKYLFKIGEEKLRLEDALIIEKTGRVVEKLVAPSIEIEPNNIASLYGARLVPIGTDMTGDGTPNILVPPTRVAHIAVTPITSIRSETSFERSTSWKLAMRRSRS